MPEQKAVLMIHKPTGLIMQALTDDDIAAFERVGWERYDTSAQAQAQAQALSDAPPVAEPQPKPLKHKS
jgi:hypothetical protein